MMSLDYVKGGEPVRAGTINSLIDAVGGGGNQSPDMIMTGTPRGSQFVMPTDMGYTQLTSQSMFDLRNYTLSGWPMAKVQLGFSLNDALDAVRVHTEDGTQHATSAVLLYKNSNNCPIQGGNLSGYVLQEDDFAKDAPRGATGWVKTNMEGVYGQNKLPNLQVWKTENNVIEVIGNTDGGDETEQKLSSILHQGGMEDSELSTLKMLDKWTLVNQTRLGGGQNGKPTDRTICKNGTVDLYEFSSMKNERAMLKAFLACYNASEGEGSGRDSDWTWLIPLGPGADYSEDGEGVWTTQFAYGGDPIVVKAEKGALDENFDG